MWGQTILKSGHIPAKTKNSMICSCAMLQASITLKKYTMWGLYGAKLSSILVPFQQKKKNSACKSF